MLGDDFAIELVELNEIRPLEHELREEFLSANFPF